MNQIKDKSYNTPILDKTSKLKPNFYRKTNAQEEETKPNHYKIKLDTKMNANSRGYSCKKFCYLGQVSQKYQNSGMDQMIKNSQPYKQLVAKMKKLEYQHNIQKQAMIKSINTKNQNIAQLKEEELQLQKQKQDLLQMESILEQKLNRIKQQNDRIRQYIELCQNGQLDLDILQYAMNTDNMTYQQLLELQQKMGSVSKGFTQEQMLSIPKQQYQQDKTDELCTICYYEFQKGEITNLFNCKHRFHHDCISSWLLKERICPMCKQEIQLPIQMPQ